MFEVSQKTLMKNHDPFAKTWGKSRPAWKGYEQTPYFPIDFCKRGILCLGMVVMTGNEKFNIYYLHSLLVLASR